MKNVVGLWAAFAVFGGALAACSSSGGGSIAGPCALFLYGPPQLLYPIPGATGVPVSAGYLVVQNFAMESGSLTLVPASGSTITAGPLGPVPTPVPSPAVTGVSSTTAQAAPIPTLSAATAYSVAFTAVSTATSSDPCNHAASGTIGSFSTR